MDPNGVSTAVQGYDRLIAIGDMNNWHDYEVTVPITVHQSYHNNPWPSNEPAVGIAMRWTGHYQVGNDQPTTGYTPTGAFGIFRWTDPNDPNRGAYRLYDHN